MQLVNLNPISLIVVPGLNSITGYRGQINVAQSAFWGIGAYVTAWLGLHGLGLGMEILGSARDSDAAPRSPPCW